MKLKISQIKSLIDSYSKLDRYEKVVDENGKERVVSVPYDLTGKVRWNISKNLGILQSKVENFNEIQNAVLSRISDGKNIIKEDEKDKVAQFLEEMNEVLAVEEDVDGLLNVSVADLKLDHDKNTNPFPLETIRYLKRMGLITE